jgi:hypothetical protein
VSFSVPHHVRFDFFVEKTEGCWLWRGGLSKNGGYGKFSVDGRDVRAHRYAYELAYGPIPDGLVVRHRCDTPACVRPDHLLLGTQAENIADRQARGRHRVVRGEKNGAARLTDAEAAQLRVDYLTGGDDQYEIARRYGVTQPTVSRIVRGERRAA